MAAFVIDTNALIFAITGSPRLSERAATILGDPRQDRIVSPASVYEIALKHARGKLPVAPGDAQRAIARSRLRSVVISNDLMIAAASLNWGNRDPWDRIIAAAGMASGAAVVSSDAAFDELLDVERVW